MRRAALVLAAVLLLPALLPITLSGSAQAATTVRGTKSNGSCKVTGVDAKTRTFTAVAKDGKAFTFKAPKGGALPKVGKVYDITYTESPGGGPLNATTVRGTKSNTSQQ